MRRLQSSEGFELDLSVIPRSVVGPARVLTGDPSDASVLDHRQSSLPSSHYYGEYLRNPSVLLPPCSTWFMDAEGDARHGALLVEDALGLRVLSAFLSRSASATLHTLTIELRGDWSPDVFDPELRIDLRRVVCVFLMQESASLRLQEAFSRGVGRLEPRSYAVTTDAEFVPSLYSFTPILMRYLFRRVGVHEREASPRTIKSKDDQS